jgi:hypothetical protein
MRTRTKYDAAEYFPAETGQTRLATRANPSSAWSAFGAWGNINVTQVLKSDGEYIITDDISPSHGVKTVTHTKRKFTRYSIRTLSEFTNTQWREYRNGEVATYSWGSPGKHALSDFSASYPKTVNQLKAEAMHKFHKQNEVDTLLNLIESPQLITSAQSIIRLMKAHGRRVRTATGFRVSNSLPSIASSGFLGWSFGLAPLISDIQKINGAVATVKRDMDNYIRSYGREYVVNSKSVGVVNPTFNLASLGYSANPNANDGTVWHLGMNYLHMPTRLVGVRGRRAVEYNSDTFKRLDYMIRRFGATGPASLAWERIPFSFVVDWFVNLSGVVDALDNTLTGTTRHIDSVWMSEKWHVLAGVYKHRGAGYTSDLDGKQITQNELSYYHREAISPDPTIALSGRFGKKQIALTAALLHQLVANLRVWR